ncbi:hypothetical protein E2C01_098805 [Portunus trituberculatus]|uniref:Uncharacterized protein n=1 Tax=Portunus trituberculatus TaxID=210409 RepID=A0A5B7K7W4_PORTR|nr:hypothetical protein [Portunus trituberculatus]
MGNKKIRLNLKEKRSRQCNQILSIVSRPQLTRHALPPHNSPALGTLRASHPPHQHLHRLHAARNVTERYGAPRDGTNGP